jgi:hypothetical protein
MLLCAKLLIDLRGGDALRLKRRRIEDDADGAVDAADALTAAMPSTPEQPLGDRVVDVPAELLERHVGGLAPTYHDRLVLGIDARDLRLEDAFGKVAADLRDRVADVVDRAVGRRAELELHEGRAVAFADRAVDLLDAGDAADRGFDPLRDLRLHLVRRGAGLRDDETIAAGKSMSGALLTCIRANAIRPASISPTNRTIGEDRVADAPGRDVAEIHGLAFLALSARPAPGFTFCPG